MRPRVETYVPFAESFGAEAVELAALAGLALDPWQADSLMIMMAVRPDGMWSHFEHVELVPRQNGKGSILEARALAGLFLLGERLIMWSAHEYKTAMEGFRRVIRLLCELGTRLSQTSIKIDGIEVKINNTNGEESVERLDTGARIRFIARSKSSGRGFTGDCNFIDEAFAYTSEQQEALMPTMSAIANPQIVYTTSPPLSATTGEVLWRLRDRGDPSAPRDTQWVQPARLSYRDWGVGGDLETISATSEPGQIDVSDRALWHAANPALPARISVDFVETEMESMSVCGFARERLGVWPRRVTHAGSGVIPAELWASLARPPRRPAEVVMAVVVSASRAHTAIVACGQMPDGQMHLSVVDYRQGTGWVPERMRLLEETHHPLLWVAQDKGPTAAILPAIMRTTGLTAPEDRAAPRRGDLVSPWAADVAVAFGMLVDAVVERRLEHVDDTPLTAAVSGATTRALGGGTTWDFASPVDVSPLQAATLAHWAYVTCADIVTAQYDAMANIR